MDIDTDFDQVKGPLVFQHLIDKYGKEYVANVCTFTRMQMKQVIKDVGRAFGIPYEEINAFTKNIPERDADGNVINHIENLEQIPGAQDFISKYPKVIQYAKMLEGTPRQVSQHAAGVGVSPIPITDIVPVTKAKAVREDTEPGYLAQVEKENFELVGLVKLDVLRLAALVQLSLMLDLLKEYYPEQAAQQMKGEIIAENIPLDDEKTYQVLCDLDVVGIFQMDNIVVSKPVLSKMKPRNIHEVAAATALIRPGSGQVDPYVLAKADSTKRILIDPRLDRYLDSTYGVLLFQEQSMSILSTMLHISFGEADQLRRYIEKPKKYPEQYNEFINTFVEKSMENGFSKDVAEYIQNMIIESSSYSFNASHAYGYSILTVQMAWIKANYPIAFYTAMISYDSAKFNLYKHEAEKKGILILGPHINLSKSEAIIADDYIRTGFKQIKGIGDAAINIIVQNQPYKSINDFMTRAAKKAVNKKVIEILIDNDCFEGLPILFNDETVTEDSSLFNHPPLYLGRGELTKWYNIYIHYKSQTAEKNYLVEKSSLPRSLQEDTQLQFEPDGTIVVPFSMLKEFNVTGSNKDGTFTDEDLTKLIATKKRPKGRLKKEKSTSNINPILRPFLTDEQAILKNTLTNRQMYTSDILKKDGISFQLHPFYRARESIGMTNQIVYQGLCHIGGLIAEIKSWDYNRKDENGNRTGEIVKLVTLTIVTPHESLTQMFNARDLQQHKDNMYVGNYIDFWAVKNKRGTLSVNRDTIRFHPQVHHRRNDLFLRLASSIRNKYTKDTSYLDGLKQEFERECKFDPDPQVTTFDIGLI